MPKITWDVASESKCSHNTCSRKATFILRVRKLGCNFTEHFESNFEKKNLSHCAHKRANTVFKLSNHIDWDNSQ